LEWAGGRYKAANWICLGETQGRGKRDIHHHAALPRKLVWVYPLASRFRSVLLRSRLAALPLPKIGDGFTECLRSDGPTPGKPGGTARFEIGSNEK
jgi:hypothetical protein